MASAWQTTKVFVVLVGLISLAGWAVCGAIEDRGILAIAFLGALIGGVLAILWQVASFIAYVLWTDW